VVKWTFSSSEDFQNTLKKLGLDKAEKIKTGYFLILHRIDCTHKKIYLHELWVCPDNDSSCEEIEVEKNTPVIPKPETHQEKLYNIACQNKFLLKLRQLISK